MPPSKRKVAGQKNVSKAAHVQRARARRGAGSGCDAGAAAAADAERIAAAAAEAIAEDAEPLAEPPSRRL